MQRHGWCPWGVLVTIMTVVLLGACASVQDHDVGLQPGRATIHGHVSPQLDDGVVRSQGLEGVEVSVAGTTLSTITAADGSFTLHEVPTGEIELVFRASGHAVYLTLEGISANQTIRLRVRLSAEQATIEAISHSNDELTLVIEPDVWQLWWADEPVEPADPGDPEPIHGSAVVVQPEPGVVTATITGFGADTGQPGADACFELRYQPEDANASQRSLEPMSIARNGDAVVLAFDQASALALFDEPEVGDAYEVRVAFWSCPDDDGSGNGATQTLAEGTVYELTATVTIADDGLDESPPVADEPTFTAFFDPNQLVLPLDTVDADGAEALALDGLDDPSDSEPIPVRVIIQGAPEALDAIDLESLSLGFEHELALDMAEVDTDADEPAVVATVSAADLLGLIKTPTAGTYQFWLRFELISLISEETVAVSDANGPGYVELALQLELVEPFDDDPPVAPEPEPEPDPDAEPLTAEFQPAVWNTNWSRQGAGWVTLKIRGDEYQQVHLDSIRISLLGESGSDGTDGDTPADPSDGSADVVQTLDEHEPVPEVEPEPGEATLAPARVQRQGNHVRAFFYQRDAIGLIPDPVPGTSYDVCIQFVSGNDESEASDENGAPAVAVANENGEGNDNGEPDEDADGGNGNDGAACALTASVRVSGPPHEVPGPPH